MEKQEIERNYVKCKDWKCYEFGYLDECIKCEKGWVYVICFNCKKKHTLKSQWLRIDCECGGSFIPCYETSEFINYSMKDKSS